MPALKVSQDHKRLTVPWLKGLLVPGEETVTSLKELMAERLLVEMSQEMPRTVHFH